MKRTLLALLLMATAAQAQPLLRSTFTTNANQILATTSSALYPLMIDSATGTPTTNGVMFSPSLKMTGTNLSLSGRTNLIADNGTALTYNGTAIGGSGDTTFSNIVTLTMTGTNVSSMDFALVQNGGVFKLSLTNNGYISSPANVVTTSFKKAWLIVQQPSTGTCILQFTNGVAGFAWSEGVSPVIDTNNGSVAVFEFVSDVFTNGLAHGALTRLSKTATNL